MPIEMSDDAKLSITILACTGAYAGGMLAGANEMSLRQVFEGAVAGAIAVPAAIATLVGMMCLAEIGYHKTWEALDRACESVSDLFSGPRSPS